MLACAGGGYDEELGDVGGAGARRGGTQARDPSLGGRSFGAPSQDPLPARLHASGDFIATSSSSRENIARLSSLSSTYHFFPLHVSRCSLFSGLFFS